MRFVMMDIDAVPIRIGRINVKSWNDFQSSHWFAAIARLPFAPILAIFGIVMRLHVAHTRGQPVAWKNAKMPLNYVRLNADCTLSLSRRVNRIAGKTIWRFTNERFIYFRWYCAYKNENASTIADGKYERTIGSVRLLADRDRLWKMKID